MLPILVSEGFVETRFLDDGPATLSAVDGGSPVTVRALPYRLSPDGERTATGFLLERDESQLAVVADDTQLFDTDRLPPVDALVFECGYFEHAPDGERLRAPTLKTDDHAHDTVLERLSTVTARRIYLSHLGHQYGRTHEDYQKLAASYRVDPNTPNGIRFPHDGQTVTVGE